MQGASLSFFRAEIAEAVAGTAAEARGAEDTALAASEASAEVISAVAAAVQNGKNYVMSAVISIKNGSVFQHEHQILKDINLDINEGEFVYLIGRSGSGKSSLLKTLYADIPAKDGQFDIAGFNLIDIKRKDIPMLRRKIGIVFQDFQLLYDRNVEQNLSFVLKATGWDDDNGISRRIDEVLQLVGLQGKRTCAAAATSSPTKRTAS